jgi:hypothetical protein
MLSAAVATSAIVNLRNMVIYPCWSGCASRHRILVIPAKEKVQPTAMLLFTVNTGGRRQASNMQKGRRPTVEVMGDGFANRDGAKMETAAGVRFAKSAGCSDAGLSRGLRLGSWHRAAPAGACCSGKHLCWLGRHCSLFDPRRRRGRPRAHHGAQRQALGVFDGSLMGANRSGARRPFRSLGRR